MFDEIGHVEILEDLISNYFVSRTTLNNSKSCTNPSTPSTGCFGKRPRNTGAHTGSSLPPSVSFTRGYTTSFRFACLLREYGISDSEILPIDIDGKSMASREETQEQTQERDAAQIRADITQGQQDRLEDQCEQLELERNHYWDDRDRLRD